ncbi:Fibronectin type III domain-containing protein 3B, variant 2 [Trebouxia sp. C0010 RCD-2024]
MSTSCAEIKSMPGTSLGNGDTAAPCKTNGERGTIPEQRNGIRPGFLNKHSTTLPEDAEPDAEPAEVPPEYVPRFSQATPPSMVTVDFTSITLQWSAVSQTGLSVSPPEGTELPSCSIAYSLQMQQVETRSTATGAELAGMCKSDKWVEVYRGTDLLTQVRNLRPGRRYAFRLVCIPVVPPELTAPASQPTSPPVAFANPATVPGAPQPPRLGGRGRTNLTFRWVEPEDTGGRDVYLYHLQMMAPATQQGFETVYEGEEKRYKAARLVPGNEYRARVKAFNIIGESVWSDEASFTTQATVPERPDPLECTPDGPSDVLVTWGVPADGGAPINTYQLQRSDGDGPDSFEPIYNGTECQYRVSGLRSGVLYRFRVLAENEEGRGAWSNIAAAQTAAVPPDSPSMPTVLGSNRTSVSIKWEAPEADGGSPVSSYQVELRPKSKAGLAGMSDEWLTVYQGEATACTMSCLYAGCVYRVRIRAKNASGWSQYSIPSDVKAAPGVPHAPGAPQSMGQSAVAIELAWEAPQHDGGSDIMSYRLEMSEGASNSGFKTVQTRSATEGCRANVHDLMPGTQYFFQVYAVNNQGASAASGTGSATTRPAPPLAPPPPTPSDITSSSFKLSWACPQARGAPVTEYMVNLHHVPEAVPSTNTLSNGHAHANGNSVLDSLDDTSSTSGSTAQAQDTRQGAEAASVSGRAGLAGGKGSFHGVGQSRLPWRGADPSVNVTGLHPFQEYSCQVQAGNSAGFSDWSSTAFVRTAPAAPSAPTNLQAQGASSSSISLHWEQPEEDNGSPVTGYLLESASTSGRVAPVYQKAYSGKDTRCTVSDLRPGRGYQFRVLAQNAQGQGPWSQPLHASAEADVPGAPSQPVCSKRTSNGVTVKWVAPEVENGSPVISYRLQCHQEGQPFEEVYRGCQLQYRLQGLEAGTSYSLRVQAVNGVGEGCWSEEAGFATTRLPPQPPQGLECTLEADPMERPQLTLTWNPHNHDGVHADVASHEVELLDVTAPSTHAVRVAKHTCSGRMQQHSIPNLLPGTRYQVRLRCVGSQGSGHGDYCDPVIISTPGSREPVSKPASVMSETSSSTLPLALSSNKGRRGSMTGAEADVIPTGNERIRKIKKGGKAGQ